MYTIYICECDTNLYTIRNIIRSPRKKITLILKITKFFDSYICSQILEPQNIFFNWSINWKYANLPVFFYIFYFYIYIYTFIYITLYYFYTRDRCNKNFTIFHFLYLFKDIKLFILFKKIVAETCTNVMINGVIHDQDSSRWILAVISRTVWFGRRGGRGSCGSDWMKPP